MRFFNTFKKDKKQYNKSKEQLPDLFHEVKKYNEYLVNFMKMQQQGDYAPISAYEDTSGKLSGFLFVNSDNSYTLSAEDVVKRMLANLEKKLADNKIRSYTIFYHSQFNNDDNHTLAHNDDELKAITIVYNFYNQLKGQIGLPYIFENDDITYSSFQEFNQNENASLIHTKLKTGYNYFEVREEITPPKIVNKYGLKIIKANAFDLINTWCGIFGFDTYRSKDGNQVLKDYFTQTLNEKPYYENNIIRSTQLQFEDIAFKAVTVNNKPRIIIPEVKTDVIIPINNIEIQEWENMGNQVAIVKAKGKDTFAFSFLATDYAENKEKYLSEQKHRLKVSGIAFVIDVFKNSSSNDDIKYSPEFTAYFPNQDLPNYACFDFIGELEDYKETTLLNDNSLKGYIMKVRLITNPDIQDFFTIHIFAHPENMRIKTLEKGMKLTGMFQMQGHLSL